MRRLAPLALLLGLAVTPAMAQESNSESATVFRAMSKDNIRTILEGMDITFKEKVNEGNGSTLFIFSHSGTNVVLNLPAKGNAVKFMCWITPGSPLSLEKVNKWNQSKSFGRVSIDKDGDLQLNYDLDLDGGAPASAVKEGIRTFQALLSLAKKELLGSGD